MNKVVAYISLIALLGVMLSGIGILAGNYIFYNFFSASSSLFLLSSVYLLIKNGTFIHSQESRIARLGISIILIGVLFKIMHWTYANELLGAGFLTIFVTYSYHFTKKTTKTLVDWGKIAFLAMEFSGSYFKIMHMAFADFLIVSSLLVLMVLTIRFIYINRLAF